MTGPEFNPADNQPVDREEWEKAMRKEPFGTTDMFGSDDSIERPESEGEKLARGIFSLCGNPAEIPISEAALARHLSLAFKRGVRASIRQLRRLVADEIMP